MIRLPPPLRIVSLVWQEIESILLVTLFTGLIWLYAEGENVKERELSFYVQFTPSGGQPLLIEPAGLTVQVKFTAATSQYEQVRRLSTAPMQVPVSESPEGRETDVNLRDAIARAGDFQRLGLTITDVQPARRRIVAESFVSREVDLVLDREGSNVTAEAGSLTLTPSKITVRMPASRWTELTEAPKVALRVL